MRFDIPILRPELTTAENWISFNYAKGCEEPSEHGVHFFVDDYQFNRIWAHPDNYLGMMARFDTVCTPDFSTYTDFPRIIQIYNHYRKHWLGAYWQAHGIKVIPTISWSTPDSFAWCFDGEPVGGAVAVSSVGTQASPESAALTARADHLLRQGARRVRGKHFSRYSVSGKTQGANPRQKRIDRIGLRCYNGR